MPDRYDVTVPISEALAVWPGDAPVRRRTLLSRCCGDPVDLSAWEMGAHSGTHVDAPRHFIPGGGVEELPLDALIGPAELVDAGDADPVPAAVIAGATATGRVLVRTAASAVWAAHGGTVRPPAVRLDLSAAEALVAAGVRLVGIDSLSVGDAAVHRCLLGAGVVVVEGLALHGVPLGRWRLMCLPLKLVGSDGAPARAVLEAC